MNERSKTKAQLMEELRDLRTRLSLSETLSQGDSMKNSGQPMESRFSSVQSGVLWQSSDGRIIHANKIASDIFGIPAETIRGRSSLDPIWKMVDESGNPVPGDKHPSMITLQTGKPILNTVRGLFSDKSTEMLWLLISTEPIYSKKEEKPSGVLITFNDITELKKMQFACLESETAFRSLLKQSEDCVILHDLKGKIVEANDKACMTLQYSREELLAMNAAELELDNRITGESSFAWEKMEPNKALIFSSLRTKRDGTVFSAEIRLCLVDLKGEQFVLLLSRDASECLRYLEKSEKIQASFLRIIEENPDAVIIVSEDGTIAYANPSACKIFSTSKDDLVGKPFGTPLGEGHTTEISIAPPAQKIRYGEMRIIDTEWKDEPAKLVMLRDITERKAAEKVTKEALEQLKSKSAETEALLSSANSILSDNDFATTARHIFDLCSRLCGASAGYVALLSEDGEENELLFLEAGGMPCTVNPTLPMPVRGLRKEAYNSGKAVFDNDFTQSKWMNFMPQGHVALKNVLFAPLNVEGKTVGVMGLANKSCGFTDEDAERATAFGKLAAIALVKSRTNTLLHEERRLLNFAIEQMPVPVIIAGAPDGKISKYNSKAVELLAQPVKDLSGIKLEDHSKHWPVMHPDGTPFPCEELPLVLAIREGKTTLNQEMIIRHGECNRWFTVSAAPLHDQKGKIIAGIEIFPEITEFKLVEKEKEHFEQQYHQVQKVESIGRLAGGVAHDLNNLLSPILGYAEMLKDDPVLDETLQEPMGEIMNAGLKAKDLVQRLLAFSRKQTLEYSPVDISKTLKGFEKLLRRTIREDIDISLITPPSTPIVMADVVQIEQVIMNLAVNAQDAMPQGGYLVISITPTYLDEDFAARHPGSKPGFYVQMSISDTGCGMEKEILDNVFEPFFSTKGILGTGLGLATVYGIVKQHGGNIWAVSEPGKGTTFQIYLPVSKELPDKKNTSKTESTNLQGSETILLVEDDNQVLHLARSILERLGYTVHAASSGAEALEILATIKKPVHILLTDVVMPKMNGRELVKKVSELYPSLKVIFMSGYADDVIAEHGVLEEGTAYIQKPFSVQSLSAKVREVLDQ